MAAGKIEIKTAQVEAKTDRGGFSAIFETLNVMDHDGVRFLNRVDVMSLDHVARGAGIGTRTERIKRIALGVDLRREWSRYRRTLARLNGVTV